MGYMESPSLHFPKLETIAKALVWPQPSDQGGFQVTAKMTLANGLPQLTRAPITPLTSSVGTSSKLFLPEIYSCYKLPSARLLLAKRALVPTQGTHFLSRQVVLALTAPFTSGAYIPFTGEGCWEESASPFSISFWDSLTKFDQLHFLLHREHMSLVFK